MSAFDELRKNYLRASFLQARAEGKLPQWFLKQILFWLLRMVFTLLVIIPFGLLVIVPIRLIWKYTESANGREGGALSHIITFVFLAFMYFGLLGGLISAIFSSLSSH